MSILKPRELELFLGDLLSPRELSQCANRWLVVRYLAGGSSYAEIQAHVTINGVKVAGATILRAKRALSASRGGFNIALRRSPKSHGSRVVAHLRS